MNLKEFYQIDSKSRVRYWSIKVDKISEDRSDIVINAGLLDGKKIETVTSITEGKNIGKKNETTPYTQAVADAETEINKKLKNGYVDNIDNIKSKEDTLTIKKPMKGYVYDPTGKKKDSYTLEKIEKVNKYNKIGLEVKLDGFRARYVIDNDKIDLYSSGGDLVPEFPQISKSLRKLFEENKDWLLEKYNLNSLILDGEIYRHPEYENDPFGGYNAVSRAMGTRVHIDEEKLLLRSKMQFHIFDICLDKPLIKRKEIVENFHDGVDVILSEIEWIKPDEKHIDVYFERCLEKGFEGAMIKLDGYPYEYKRSKQMFKYKPSEDREFEIVGFKKSITGETLGSFQCVMDNGVTFYANPKDNFGSDKIKQEIWDNQNDYLGKYIIVEFMGVSKKDGKPRHPRAKDFRKGISID